MRADFGDRIDNARAFHRTRGARCALDTNVVLDLIVFRDPGAASLARAIEAGDVLPVSSRSCMEELRRVLAYTQLGLDAAGRLAAFERFSALVQLVEVPAAKPLPPCTDPDDQKFLQLAWHSRARCLITRDKALLRMRRALERAGGFAVLTPEDFGSCMAC